MSQTYILYNPLAGDRQNASERLAALKAKIACQKPVCVDVTTLHAYADFFECVEPEDAVYLCGGDGTLSRLANDMGETPLPCPVYYYGTGTGNDFLRDLNREPNSEPFRINDYFANLPTVTVQGKTYRFLNNVGFGIDGYCTEEGDRQKHLSDKAVNYTAIAVKGLLFHFRPTGATVTVDGQTYRYKKVWLAPTMKGRFYGGGMMPTPDQRRQNPDGRVSLMLIHGSGKLHTLLVFPTIFKGAHIRHNRMVAVHSGHDITVTFDRPCPLQIDGETIRGVTEYRVRSHPAVPAPAVAAAVAD